MNKKYFPFVLAAFLICPFFGRSAEAQCANLLDAGVLFGGWGYGSFIQYPHAQTFTPTSSGTVCEIRHSALPGTGIPPYDLYVVDAPGLGAPPLDYASTWLFRAQAQTSFTGSSGATPLAKVPVANGTPSNGFQVIAGQRYALIIVKNGGLFLGCAGNWNNPYAGGQAYQGTQSGNWVNLGTNDLFFQILGQTPPPPNNDPCASCTPIGLGTVNGTTVSATTDGSSACGGINDVWYCFTAQCSGPVTASTCAPAFDTVLSVYNAACGGAEILCNDDCPGTPCLGPGSCVVFNATCGAMYRIRVASFSGINGTFALTLTQPAPVAPSNNNAVNPIVIPPSGVFGLPFSTCGATTDGPSDCPGNHSDTWYTYTPNCQGTVSIDLCGSLFDTYLTVYTGTPGNLTLVPGTCNDDYGPVCAGLQSSVRFPGNPCTTYLIRVGGFGDQTGCGDITVSCSNATASNNLCSDAIAIGPGLTYGTTMGATPLGGTIMFPAPCGLSYSSRDVWYSYTPPCNGQLTLDTCALPCVGARYDTVVSVYKGACKLLQQVAGGCNDDANCSPSSTFCCNSRVVTNVTGGTNYKIRVSGYFGSSGNFALNLAFVQPPLTNDNICNAVQVSCGNTAFSTCSATDSPEASPGCTFFNDVWYRFTTPNCNGTVRIDTCSSALDTVLGVYSGTCTTPVFVGCNNNTPASGTPCNNGPWSFVSFGASANTTYYVRVGAATTGAVGNGVIHINCPPGLPHCPGSPPCQAMSNLFDVTGLASGAPWAFRITMPCCFDMYVPNVAGVPHSTDPDPIIAQQIDEANLAAAFVAAINARCPQVPPLATAYPSGNGVFGLFAIKACDCMPNPLDKATLSVGPAGTPAPDLCTVTTMDLPTFGPCYFNPQIVEVDLSGTDCNANGEDDYMDILNGTSLDADQNNVPDECDGGSLTTFCFPGSDGVIPCPCGNPPAGGGLGCDNFGAGPSQSGTLTASGTASLAADTIVLQAAGENNASTTVFWTGTGTNSPPGVVHGAGVRCVTGLKRLYTGSASGGAILRPSGTDPSVSARTAVVGSPISAGETRHYFNVYRDPQAAGPCGNTSSTINLTNAGSITWKP